VKNKSLKTILSTLVFTALTTGAWAESSSTRTIVDMAGRHVVIPSIIRSVYSTSPMER